MAIGNLLLEQNGSESSVHGAETLSLDHLTHAVDETLGKGGLGDETDTGGLKGAEGNVGEELGHTGRGEVDGGTVVGSSLVAKLVDGLLLEELVTTELQGTLEEVTGKGRAGTGEESASTLVLDDLAETANHATVVCSGVKLDTGLDTVKGKRISRLISVVMLDPRYALLRLRMAGQARGRSRGSAQCEMPARVEHNLHIDGSQGTVGDGAADGASKGETGVEGEAAQLLGLGSLDILDNGVELGRAGRFRVGGHCDCEGGVMR